MSEPQAPPHRDAIGRRVSRGVENVASVYVLVVFVVLWVYIAAAVFTDGVLLAETWTWLSGLDTVGAIVAWIAILPIAAWTWAWQADLQPLLMGLVVLGMVAWTAVAVTGLVKTLRSRLARRSA
jgi:hypothetical protein